jgi:hypothetical protein
METMTERQKELLLSDLSARLRYGVKCTYYDKCVDEQDEGTITGMQNGTYLVIDGVCIDVEHVRPYLFPISSITKEQRDEFPFELSLLNAFINGHISLFEDEELSVDDIIRMMDCLNRNNIDYRGLIPMGLAVDATGKNIY